MNNKILEDIKLLSTSPGCYLMYDEFDKVIYVGKAKNLKNRVSQYFLLAHGGKVGAMVSHVDHFETILTSTESEAFVLELNLIHKYMPRYNILLKDDKHYPYIALKKKGIPEVKILRNTKNKNFQYFGPYPNSTSAYKIVQLINELYPLKKCRVLPKKPCLYYSLNQCLGYCINKIDDEVIENMNNEIRDFIKGKTYAKEQDIKEKIKFYSESLQFEQAKKYADLLKDISNIKSTQNVDLHDNKDRDFFAFVSRNGYLALSLLIYRDGTLLGKDVIISEIFDEENEVETVNNLIFQYYENRDLPEEIIVYNEEIFDALKEVYPNKIRLSQKGKLYEILNILIKNASKSLDDYFISAKLDSKFEETLSNLANILSIKFPTIIELFDNSHIQGSDAVGVSVSFVNGQPCKKLYRKYHLNNTNTQDDLTNMREVLTRRYSRMKQENTTRPDLILLDGGLTQLTIAKEILNMLELDIPVFGLFKNNKHETRGIIDENGNVFDIDPKSDVFYMITNMQNEVHRFAITFFRKSHRKNMVKSIIDDIPGLGEKRKNLIYETYKDLKNLEDASLDELAQILPLSIAEELFNKIHKK